jgi:hypothetical protein
MVGLVNMLNRLAGWVIVIFLVWLVSVIVLALLSSTN